MLAMRRCGGCGYIPKGDNEVITCPVECEAPKGKLRHLPMEDEAEEVRPSDKLHD